MTGAISMIEIRPVGNFFVRLLVKNRQFVWFVC